MFIPELTLIQKCRLLFSYRGYDCKGTIRSGTNWWQIGGQIGGQFCGQFRGQFQ